MAKILQGLGPKRWESSNGDRVYCGSLYFNVEIEETRELAKILSVIVVVVVVVVVVVAAVVISIT